MLSIWSMRLAHSPFFSLWLCTIVRIHTLQSCLSACLQSKSEREMRIERAVIIKIMNRRNQNASMAVPDDSRDRRLIIDLDINQNVRHTFLFPLCRVRIYYLRRNNHLSSRFIVLYDCVLVIFLFREMLLLFASYPPPPRHHDCMLQYAARL